MLAILIRKGRWGQFQVKPQSQYFVVVPSAPQMKPHTRHQASRNIIEVRYTSQIPSPSTWLEIQTTHLVDPTNGGYLICYNTSRIANWLNQIIHNSVPKFGGTKMTSSLIAKGMHLEIYLYLYVI